MTICHNNNKGHLSRGTSVLRVGIYYTGWELLLKELNNWTPLTLRWLYISPLEVVILYWKPSIEQQFTLIERWALSNAGTTLGESFRVISQYSGTLDSPCTWLCVFVWVFTVPWSVFILLHCGVVYQKRKVLRARNLKFARNVKFATSKKPLLILWRKWCFVLNLVFFGSKTKSVNLLYIQQISPQFI